MTSSLRFVPCFVTTLCLQEIVLDEYWDRLTQIPAVIPNNFGQLRVYMFLTWNTEILQAKQPQPKKSPNVSKSIRFWIPSGKLHTWPQVGHWGQNTQSLKMYKLPADCVCKTNVKHKLVPSPRYLIIYRQLFQDLKIKTAQVQTLQVPSMIDAQPVLLPRCGHKRLFWKHFWNN